MRVRVDSMRIRVDSTRIRVGLQERLMPRTFATIDIKPPVPAGCQSGPITQLLSKSKKVSNIT
jgi:hypothetical protein